MVRERCVSCGVVPLSVRYNDLLVALVDLKCVLLEEWVISWQLGHSLVRLLFHHARRGVPNFDSSCEHAYAFQDVTFAALHEPGPVRRRCRHVQLFVRKWTASMKAHSRYGPS